RVPPRAPGAVVPIPQDALAWTCASSPRQIASLTPKCATRLTVRRRSIDCAMQQSVGITRSDKSSLKPRSEKRDTPGPLRPPGETRPPRTEAIAAMNKEEERELRATLGRLQQEHRDLDAAIEALERTPGADKLQVQRLKKRKLSLRDRITFIEDQLT